MTCDALQAVQESEPVADLAAAELAAGQFLQALGVKLDSESLRGTPARMARAYTELFTPRPFVRLMISSAKSRDRESKTWAIPSACKWLRFSGLPAVAKISAPALCASWIAASPTPPAAAWISTVCPARTAYTRRSNTQAVSPLTVMPAASTSEISAGKRMARCAGRMRNCE